MMTRNDFESLKQRIFATRKSGEHFFLSLAAEDSQFIRINGAKIRQIGSVEDGSLEITLVLESRDAAGKTALRKGARTCTVTGLSWKDWEEVEGALKVLRREVAELPVDPFAELPSDHGSGENETRGKLLPREQVVDELLSPAVSGLDLAGIYAAGPVARAMANTAGQSLWFSTETFSLDYSLYTPNQRALKGTFAGKTWDRTAYIKEMERSRERLPILEKPASKIQRGAYRTYLAPAAFWDLVHMLSWGCISEASIRQGDSAMRHVRSGEKKFSPLFSMSEDFSGGEMPRFNSLGELAPERLPLIVRGELKNTLVNSRSAKEYGVPSNGALLDESLRSCFVEAGSLEEDQILKKLDTGLYLSNLHYLNWSDQLGGRVTGMTRYACFWVENGQIIAPIENMRWDDSIFTLMGTELEALTRHRSYLPDVGTYERRGLGGAMIPGALVKAMQFTL